MNIVKLPIWASFKKTQCNDIEKRIITTKWWLFIRASN